MLVIEGRLWVRLNDVRGLKKLMKFHEFSVRSLAEAVDKELLKHDKITASSRATIGHLLSGERSTCRPETARAIEKVLEVPQGFLFEAKVSRVSRPRRTAA